MQSSVYFIKAICSAVLIMKNEVYFGLIIIICLLLRLTHMGSALITNPSLTIWRTPAQPLVKTGAS